MENFARVASLDLTGKIPGEIELTSWHNIRVYRSDIGPTRSYSVHYDITHYYVTRDAADVPTVHNVLETSEQFNFEDGSEADAKFQHLCLKAYTAVMTERNRSY